MMMIIKKKKTKYNKELAKKIRKNLRTEDGRRNIAKQAGENILAVFKIIKEEDVNVKRDKRVKQYIKNFEETMFFILDAASTDEIETEDISNRFELLDL